MTGTDTKIYSLNISFKLKNLTFSFFPIFYSIIIIDNPNMMWGIACTAMYTVEIETSVDIYKFFP